MHLVPLGFVIVALTVPTLLYRWEVAGVSPHLPTKPWARGLWATVFALILSFVGALFFVSVARGHLENLVPLALIGLLLVPWAICRAVLIPLGRWRAAWHLTQLAGWIWRGDVPGGQFVAGAWAALRSGRRDPSAIAWLLARRDELPRIEAAAVLGTALLADVAGDRERARRLMVSIASFDDRECPPIARRLAGEWRLADAAARGDWGEVELLGRTPVRATRAAAWLGAAAARLIGYPPVPTGAALVIHWLAAPRRITNFRLLRRALATARVEGTPSVRSVASPARAITTDAVIDAHTRSLVEPGADAGAILALGDAWDRLLGDPALRSRTVGRSLALHGGDPDQVITDLGQQVERDLAALARRADVPLATLEHGGGRLRRVARELRHELLDDLALASEALDQRVRDRRRLAPLDELGEFLAVRDRYERVHRLGGSELLRIAFAQAHDPLCNLAVWLWDERGETAIANAIFRWLLHEAMLAGDDGAVELQRRNAACGA